MRYLLFVSIACVALSACQTKPIEEMSYSEKKALAEQIVKRCVAQGVKHDTPEMRDCSRAEVQREYATRQNNAFRQQRAAAAFANYGNQMQAHYRNQQMINAMNRPVNCTSNRFGSTITTNCY
ncbi:hypothetical protein IB024_01830 [Brucella sp. 6810]|uniref:hypothetical protein n=1 Tax=Brucella sp. 6810 TaxID=2769351 RepID=UPI00165A8C70|nr:hypothetical protein [Brucella sp. 6810]QNQ62523.1 hypothetical protein IB024_01830 [Brucella sp. 6810]